MPEIVIDETEIAVSKDRTDTLYFAQRDETMRWTDRLFAALILFQWVACVLTAIFISPKTWIGLQSQVHPHVWAAVFIGGALASLPICLAWFHPGKVLTRHVIAVSQMLFGSLMIHLTGGRIETHFHVFGSLAFLAFYRDWRVLITATLVVAMDHFFRGIWWPLSVFGDSHASQWRWLEHAGWVVFMDIFLITVALRSNRELRMLAGRQAEADAIRMAIEATVVERTRELAEAKAVADSACQAKSEFLANMSHEIRTPLTAVLGYCDILRDDGIIERAPPRRIQTIATIRRAGEHLMTVINDILDLSKIEAGKLQTEMIETNLPRVLLEVDSLVRPRVAGKRVDLRLRLESSIPERIISDPTRLRQILLNLVGNAVKFTEQGFIEVRIRTRQQNGQNSLAIEVQDTGAGMTPEKAQMLFNPFTQADASVTRSHGGTGLGLTISRRLARMMGGDVWLDFSAPGQGTRFAFEMPLQLAPESLQVTDLSSCTLERNDSGASTSITLSGRILLAEDGEDNQYLISLYLKKAGADVDVADNGRIALEMMQSAAKQNRPYHLLVTDMQMPEMDGYTLAKTLRADGDLIPIIALTAHAMAEDRIRCLNAGCDDYATKPINKNELIASCSKWMRKLSGVDESPHALLESHSKSELESKPEVVGLISELADDPDMRPLVTKFLTNLPPKVMRMSECLVESRLKDLETLAHQLGGAGGGYGYPAISDAARRVERAAKIDPEPDLDQVRGALNQLSLLCQQAVKSGLQQGSFADSVGSKGAQT
ncbi:ATP-binding protein [Schlesneria paludicola]|uniref:ATP-binding protein n=1 Tax=Schlesneria paludicola TaxID=360056 RepID=UPI00029B3770|nr:ATP-binding protein [Schlesneria paludicola]